MEEMEEEGGFIRVCQNALHNKKARKCGFSDELLGYAAARVQSRIEIQYVSDVFLARGVAGADISL